MRPAIGQLRAPRSPKCDDADGHVRNLDDGDEATADYGHDRSHRGTTATATCMDSEPGCGRKRSARSTTALAWRKDSLVHLDCSEAKQLDLTTLWLSCLEVVLVNLFEYEGFLFLDADAVPNHELTELCCVDEDQPGCYTVGVVLRVGGEPAYPTDRGARREEEVVVGIDDGQSGRCYRNASGCRTAVVR